MFEKLLYKLLDYFERVIQKKSVEFRMATYKEYWPWFKKYHLYMGDLIKISGEKYIAIGMSKGPGFYSGDCVPIQFTKIPKNSNGICFFHPDILHPFCYFNSQRELIIKHYSPKEFKDAKELYFEH